jgi:hypothetical protein
MQYYYVQYRNYEKEEIKFNLARQVVTSQATVLHSNCSFSPLPSCFNSLSSFVAAFFCLTPSVSLFICLSLGIFFFYYLIFLYCSVDLFPYFYSFPTFCLLLFIFSFSVRFFCCASPLIVYFCFIFACSLGSRFSSSQMLRTVCCPVAKCLQQLLSHAYLLSATCVGCCLSRVFRNSKKCLRTLRFEDIPTDFYSQIKRNLSGFFQYLIP